jgi:prepilin-type N-terminal cleavage/methylation domain-containing protein
MSLAPTGRNKPRVLDVYCALSGLTDEGKGPLLGRCPRLSHDAPLGLKARRSAFTLVELLVVIGLILVMAAIAVLFVPRAQDADKAGGGARQVVGMFQVSKTRAMRDQAPRGVRLLVTGDPAQITELQFIEQPADFYDPNISILTPSTSPIVLFDGDLSGGFGPFSSNPLPPTSWPVQPGDYLEVNGGGLLHRIMNVVPFRTPAGKNQTQVFLRVVNTTGNLIKKSPTQITIPLGFSAAISIGMSLTLGSGNTQETATVIGKSDGTSATTLTLMAPHNQTGMGFAVQNDPPLVFPAGCPYRIIRGPRPVAGEDGLTLPVDVAIQLKVVTDPTKPNYDPPVTVTSGTAYYDILFAPSGAVIGGAAANDKIVCWVRDVSQSSVIDNNPVLVAIYTRSGMIAAHPVDVTPGGDLYSFTVDGRSSGE